MRLETTEPLTHRLLPPLLNSDYWRGRGRWGGITFSDGGAGGSLLVLQPDLLQRHQVVCELAASFEHRGVGSLKAPRARTG